MAPRFDVNAPDLYIPGFTLPTTAPHPPPSGWAHLGQRFGCLEPQDGPSSDPCLCVCLPQLWLLLPTSWWLAWHWGPRIGKRGLQCGVWGAGGQSGEVPLSQNKTTMLPVGSRKSPWMSNLGSPLSLPSFPPTTPCAGLLFKSVLPLGLHYQIQPHPLPLLTSCHPPTPYPNSSSSQEDLI